MTKVKKIEVLSDYQLKVEFVDGVIGTADLSHLVGKCVFNQWKDYRIFEQAHVGSSGQIKWNDEIEICSDALYLKISCKNPEELFPLLKPETINA
ncbi:MAG: DUF2442 domain-containing protein [Bacteroidota bacterium]|nr:DUF2442 domain-containing protein [Bacteroidota bacterium]